MARLVPIAGDRMRKVLALVDHARGISGPHRNLVGSLNALAARGDIEVRLLCHAIDEKEPYARGNRIDIRLGYNPANVKRLPVNVWRVLVASTDVAISFMCLREGSLYYAQAARLGRHLVVGPNVIPPLYRFRSQNSPHRLELKLLCDCWIEASPLI